MEGDSFDKFMHDDITDRTMEHEIYNAPDYDHVRFGSEKPVLEIELNELQNILSQKSKVATAVACRYPCALLTYQSSIIKCSHYGTLLGLYMYHASILCDGIVYSIKDLVSNSDAIYVERNSDNTIVYIDTSMDTGYTWYVNPSIDTVDISPDDRIKIETTKRGKRILKVSKDSDNGYPFMKISDENVSKIDLLVPIINIYESFARTTVSDNNIIGPKSYLVNGCDLKYNPSGGVYLGQYNECIEGDVFEFGVGSSSARKNIIRWTSDAVYINGTLTASGALTANGGISTTTLTTSGALTAKGGISTNTLTTSGTLTANGGISTTGNTLIIRGPSTNAGTSTITFSKETNGGNMTLISATHLRFSCNIMDFNISNIDFGNVGAIELGPRVLTMYSGDTDYPTNIKGKLRISQHPDVDTTNANCLDIYTDPDSYDKIYIKTGQTDDATTSIPQTLHIDAYDIVMSSFMGDIKVSSIAQNLPLISSCSFAFPSTGTTNMFTGGVIPYSSSVASKIIFGSGTYASSDFSGTACLLIPAQSITTSSQSTQTLKYIDIASGSTAIDNFSILKQFNSSKSSIYIEVNVHGSGSLSLVLQVK